MRTACLQSLLAAFVLVLLAAPLAGLADKPSPVVTARWRGTPVSSAYGRNVSLVLRITSSRDVSDVTVDVMPPAGVRVVSGTRQWSGSLSANQVFELPFALQAVADGVRVLGTAITNRMPGDVQKSGTQVWIVAKDGVATFTLDPPLQGNKE